MKKNLPGKHRKPKQIDAENIVTEQKLYDVSSDSEPLPVEDAGQVADESDHEAFNNETPPLSADRGEQ